MREWLPSDYSKFCQWFLSRALHPPPKDALPKTGFIVEDVGAAFLMRTDSKVALIEYVCTNPYAQAEKRDNALDAIFNELQFTAKKSGFKYLVGSTQLKDIEKRGEKYGFKDLGNHRAFMKEL